ncbi:MAG: alpha/beta fold hydrolase [Rhizobiaceae bacterium]
MIAKILLVLVALVAVIAAVLAFGPREPVDETITFDSSRLDGDLDAYLADQERTVANLIPGAAKHIVWHDTQSKQPTPVSLVYLHGFSATLEEIRPMPDLVAQSIGANLFYARLSGHGRDGAALAEPAVNDWFNDTAEALEIGRRIGQKVVVIAVSTGATFATWAATRPELMRDVAGVVLISPNYGVNNSASRLLTLGAARFWVPLIAGAERSFETINADHAKWWTSAYPTVALLPMMASVAHSSELDLESISTPALFIYHPDDAVVRSDISKQFAERWGADTGASATIFEVSEAEDRFNHVIAGRILSPANSKPLAQRAVDWINGL